MRWLGRASSHFRATGRCNRARHTLVALRQHGQSFTVGRECVSVSECGLLAAVLGGCGCICMTVVYGYDISRRALPGRLGTQTAIIYEHGGQCQWCPCRFWYKAKRVSVADFCYKIVSSTQCRHGPHRAPHTPPTTWTESSACCVNMEGLTRMG